MNLIEIFHEYLDQLYWTGYAEFLLQNDAKTYQFEYEIFSHIYDYQTSESTYSKVFRN